MYINSLYTHKPTINYLLTSIIYVEILVAEQQIKVNHVPSEFQSADCMTKSLHKPRLMKFFQAINMNYYLVTFY